MLLIVTNQSDLSSDYLILRLHERDITFERLNTESYPSGYDIALWLNDQIDFEITLNESGRQISLAEVDGVYFRQPSVPSLEGSVSKDHREFAEREMTEAMRSLWRLIPEERWLNHPEALWIASNKIKQLKAARNLELLTPDTCVTTKHSIARGFAEKHDYKLIAKAVRQGFVADEESALVAPTQRVDRGQLEELREFAPGPIILQPELAKECDVRVTVVGDHVFATAIMSQEYEATSVDWRVSELTNISLNHTKVELPDETRNKCRALTKWFNLGYSAIDLVRTPSHEYVFLELNPNGQWVWIEKNTGYPVRDAIIDELGFGRN